MCAQFLLIKDWLFEGKANLKCSYTTCTLIVLKRSFRKDDDAFKRSNKYVFFPASERCKYYVLRALQLFKHSLVTEKKINTNKIGHHWRLKKLSFKK